MPAEPKYPKDKDVQQSAAQDQSIQQGKEAAKTASSSVNIPELMKAFSDAGGVPISVTQSPLPRIDTGQRLTDNFKPVTVAFPPCSAEMLALIKTTNNSNKDDIVKYFDEYFKFGNKHVIINGQVSSELDPNLLNCDDVIFLRTDTGSNDESYTEWLGDCCVCSPCLTLDGNRNALSKDPPPPPPSIPSIKRLFAGDVVWLFFFERLGIFQILGAILDAYASNGRLPISNGSLDIDSIPIKDDIIALVLEVMTRQTKMGMSSTVRDRACTYRTVLDWTSTSARKLDLDTARNTGFTTLFHKFIYHALEFYKDKRLAVAIQGAAGTGTPLSMATLTAISDTLVLLQKRFEAFAYGRNYYNALSGIVWTIAGMSIIRELRTTLGIPPAFNAPDEYIPAAYDLLVLKRPVTSGETNRYLVHKECANNGRDILLDIEVVDVASKTKNGGELEKWLDQIESKIEGYRTAYRSLTGVDIGLSPNPVIEQQV